MMGAGEGAPPRPPAFVLSLSLLSMTMAGSTYWAPSLAAAIAGPLALAPSATAVFAASVNAGYIFCVFSGILHGRLGPRRTAMVGSAGLCATYLAIAVVVLVKPAFPMLFLAPLAGKLLLLLTLCLSAGPEGKIFFCHLSNRMVLLLFSSASRVSRNFDDELLHLRGHANKRCSCVPARAKGVD
jgi:hypothetical protein